MYYYDIYEKKKYYCPYVDPIDAFVAACMDVNKHHEKMSKL